MTLSRSLAETMRSILDAQRADLHTAMPGTVESYDAESQTADIRPGLLRVTAPADDDEDSLREELPVIPRVPVLWPRAGAFYVHAELQEGDGVMLVFCEAQIDAWLAGAKAGDPGTPERHGLAGAVAIPGLSANANRIDDAGANPGVGLDGAERIEWTGGEIHVGGSDPLALAAALDALVDALEAAPLSTGGGSVLTAIGTSLNLDSRWTGRATTKVKGS